MRLIRLIITVIVAAIPSWINAITVRRFDKFKIHSILRKWSSLAIKMLNYKLEVEGSENLNDEATYFVSNHQGTFDPAIIVAASTVPISFISKKQNEKLPLIGSWSKTIKNIHFDRDSAKDNIYMLREATRRLKAKDNVLIFAEGTRSKSDVVNEFKVGSIKPAYMAKVQIVPVVLSNSYAFDEKKPKSNKMKVNFLKPIKHEEYKHLSQEEICVHLRELIESKVNV
ncbi:MAG: lysophospholipid acyltransferase family protein [Bacillota bacterium]|jgi:1-acyl-sn-glycerol-3-phosphate acyltransferase|nr:lysophospholipid acyltransferase family protein [Bacillota bacterium]